MAPRQVVTMKSRSVQIAETILMSSLETMVLKLLSLISIVFWDCFSIKITSYQYKNYHCKDQMIMRSSYLHDGNPHTWKDSFYSKISPLFFGRLLHDWFQAITWTNEDLLVRCSGIHMNSILVNVERVLSRIRIQQTKICRHFLQTPGS